MVNIPRLIAANQARWDRMHLRANRVGGLMKVANRLAGADAKFHYQQVEKVTGVPWFVIAVIHEREASQSWAANIAQGDPWNRVSRHVPAGRGPFKDWQSAAVDALVHCAPHAARWHDWTPGGALTILEEYNGLGYAAMGVPSAYVFSGSDQYVSGKYIRDHVYSRSAVDVQEGCAPLLSCMMTLDKSIKFADGPHKDADPVQVEAMTPRSSTADLVDVPTVLA